MVAFVNPINGHRIERRDDMLYDTETGVQVARIEQEIPRFVEAQAYAESFGWQWNRWEDTLSDSRRPSNKNAKRRLLLERTRFDAFDMQGKTILECGMGGRDDTEILLSLPFAEVHSFDISHSVDRARRHLDDPRLVISQADIHEIPYPDKSSISCSVTACCNTRLIPISGYCVTRHARSSRGGTVRSLLPQIIPLHDRI